MPEPNLQAIAKNAASATASTKEVIARCMNALGWIASPQHTAVSSRRNVDAAAGPLAIELTAQALKISNVITDDAAAVPQKKIRTVFLGALLAFCDQRMPDRIGQIRLETVVEKLAYDLHRIDGDA